MTTKDSESLPMIVIDSKKNPEQFRNFSIEPCIFNGKPSYRWVYTKPDDNRKYSSKIITAMGCVVFQYTEGTSQAQKGFESTPDTQFKYSVSIKFAPSKKMLKKAQRAHRSLEQEYDNFIAGMSIMNEIRLKFFVDNLSKFSLLSDAVTPVLAQLKKTPGTPEYIELVNSLVGAKLNSPIFADKRDPGGKLCFKCDTKVVSPIAEDKKNDAKLHPAAVEILKDPAHRNYKHALKAKDYFDRGFMWHPIYGKIPYIKTQEDIAFIANNSDNEKKITFPEFSRNQPFDKVTNAGSDVFLVVVPGFNLDKTFGTKCYYDDCITIVMGNGINDDGFDFTDTVADFLPSVDDSDDEEDEDAADSKEVDKVTNGGGGSTVATNGSFTFGDTDKAGIANAIESHKKKAADNALAQADTKKQKIEPLTSAGESD